MKPTGKQKKPGRKPRLTATPNSSSSRGSSSFPDAPVSPVTNPRATKVPKGSGQKFATGQRFSRSHHLVFRSANKTHRISLRLAAVFLFILVGLLIIANPLTQYLAQQEEIRKAQSHLQVLKERVESLENEKALWSDPVFIQSKARERLGFVMPGQTLYTTPDPQYGNALEQRKERTEEVVRLRREQTPFFITSWDSLAVAGQVGELDNPQHAPVLNEDSAVTPDPDKDADTKTDTDAKTKTDTDTGTKTDTDADKEKENE